MVDTALTIITDALLDLGVIADGETPDAAKTSQGLRKFNNLIDSLNIENLMTYGATQNVFPLVANQQSYTLGTGGNFNIPRPNNVVSAYIRDNNLPASNRPDYPVTIYNDQEYADITLKGMTGALPWGVWIDNSYPLSTVTLTPIPSTSQYSLVLWTEGILGNLQLNTVINLPPGYKRMLTAALVVEIAPSYGQPVPQATVEVARSSKENLKIQNFQLNELSVPTRSGRYNYITDSIV